MRLVQIHQHVAVEYGGKAGCAPRPGHQSASLGALYPWSEGAPRPCSGHHFLRRKWWRRGESEYSGLLKTRKLLIFRDAKNAENGKIAPNWNVSGTRDFRLAGQFREQDLPSPATA